MEPLGRAVAASAPRTEPGGCALSETDATPGLTQARYVNFSRATASAAIMAEILA